MSVRSKVVVNTEAISSANGVQTRSWLEWNDDRLNNEKWMLPKNGEDGMFLDTESVPLPPSLEVYEWVRHQFLRDLTDLPVLYSQQSGYPDLIVNNKHILHSEFMRWFISSLINLQYCGRKGLDISGESENFLWSSRGLPWRGWMHVYSMNKAGKGAQHRPLINSNGKYVVRLFWMGYWRYIFVDDLVPVDMGGQVLLPCTANLSELWPMLLAKALLKIASLTWVDSREIVDFDPVHNFTGWVRLSLNVSHLSSQDKWEFIILKYTEHFQWTPETEQDPEADTVSQVKGKAKARDPVAHDPRPVTLFLDLKGTRNVDNDAIPDITPCWGHPIHVVQCRDIPLDPEDMKPPMARWKLYRWVNWAIANNIIDPHEYFEPIRSLKVVSPFKQCKDHVVYVYNWAGDGEGDVGPGDRGSRRTDTLPTPKQKTPPDKYLKKHMPDEPMPEIAQWAEFYKMSPFIKSVHLFYKLDRFAYTVVITEQQSGAKLNFTEKPKDTKKETVMKSGRKTDAMPVIYESVDQIEFTNSYVWPRHLEKSRNEPLYLLCDSLEPKFFLIDLSTDQPHPFVDASATLADGRSIESLPQPPREACLVVENHNWFLRKTKSKPLVSIFTIGSKSVVFELKPGRAVLRLYCRSECERHVTISSDTIFFVGDQLTMYRLMPAEALRVDTDAMRLSQSIANAYSSFATPNYREALKEYYASHIPTKLPLKWSPPGITRKQYLNRIHELFIEEQVRLIRAKFTNVKSREILRALRIFFVDPTIGMDKLMSSLSVQLESDTSTALDSDLHTSVSDFDEEAETETIDFDRAATIIQSFFRMVRIKIYMRLHSEDTLRIDKQARVLEELLQVVKLFTPDNPDSLAHQLLRSAVNREDDICRLFACAEDFTQVLQVQECKGVKKNIGPKQWTVLLRFTMNAKHGQAAFARLHITVPGLPRYMLRGFDNVTGNELFRISNDVSPCSYPWTKCGYTILAYGWSTDDDKKFKDIPWTLRVVTVKGEPMLYKIDDPLPISLMTRLPDLAEENTFNTYIPNTRNRIAKWIVKIAAPTILTMRLRTSYEGVQMRVRVTNSFNEKIVQVMGGSAVILPVIYLAYDFNAGSISKKPKSASLEEPDQISLLTKEYYIEAYVVNDSWPLTGHEWNVVIEAKSKVPRSIKLTHRRSTNLEATTSAKVLQGTPKRSSIHSSSSVNLEPPYWVLQCITEAANVPEIRQDLSKEEEIAALKRSWSIEDRSRPQRGKALRDQFIAENAVNLEPLPSQPSVLKPSGTSATPMSLEPWQRQITAWLHHNHDASRSLKRPKSYTAYLPPQDLTVFMRLDDEVDDPWVKVDVDEEMLKNQRSMNVIDSERSHCSFLEENSEFNAGHISRYQKLMGGYEDRFWKRRELLERANDWRQVFVVGNEQRDTGKDKGKRK